VVNPEEQVVWVWRFGSGATEPERVGDRLYWRPVGAGRALELTTEEIFRPM